MPDDMRGRSRSSQADRLWHPWLRVNRLILEIRRTTPDAAQWPVAKVALKRALTERRKLTRSGWWN